MIFVVTGHTAEEIQHSTIATKSQIAFYASTPSYKAVLEMHGWGDIAERLTKMIRENRWTEMWTEISDEMLNEIAVVATPEELPYKVKERYEGLLNRVGYYFPFMPEEAEKRVVWEQAAKVFG